MAAKQYIVVNSEVPDLTVCTGNHSKIFISIFLSPILDKQSLVRPQVYFPFKYNRGVSCANAVGLLEKGNW